MQRMRVVRAVAVAALAAGVLTTPASGAACPMVRRSGPWAATDTTPPPPTVHWGPVLVAPAGPAGVLVANGQDVHRSTDGLCTWRRVYTLDPNTAADQAQQPYAAVAAAVPSFVIRSVAARPVSRAGDPRTAYVLMGANSSTDGFALNAASGSPFPLAASGDSGGTWRTDLVRAPGAGGATVPVTGNASIAATLLPAPSDPRVAYAVLGARIPGGADDPAGEDGAIYVTRDAGATWTFVTARPGGAPVVVDPVDPNLVYAVTGWTVESISTRAPVTRRPLLSVSQDGAIEGLDVVRRPGGKATLLATIASVRTGAPGWFYYAYRSVDGGRKWSSITMPLGVENTFRFAFVGGGALLAADGGMVAVSTTWSLAKQVSMLYRWDVRRRAWRKSERMRPPFAKGFDQVVVSAFVPADPARRTFLFGGVQYASDGGVLGPPIVGTYDTTR